MASKRSQYSSVDWVVRPGGEAEFITRWRALAEIMADNPAGVRSMTLLRSNDSFNVFRGFVVWGARDDEPPVELRPEELVRYDACVELCEEVVAQRFTVVAALFA
ncbi:MAG: hypothetical protein ACRDKZ_05245 [Actinomycetota bacterium]